MNISTYNKLIYFNARRAYIQKGQVLVSAESSECVFLPPFPENRLGVFTVSLEWDGLMLPNRFLFEILTNNTDKQKPGWILNYPKRRVFHHLQLRLNYLKRRSNHSFEWVPDVNIHWIKEEKEYHRNIDIFCICDGRVYIGEAKHNDKIDQDQFSFYEDVCISGKIDGIVFATAAAKWNKATLTRIEELKNRFRGEILVLTGASLRA